jgi:hypothetical protein
MGLMDKMKAQATQVAQRAQEAGKAGQAKLEEAQAKRRADALLRDLGAAIYSERRDGPTPETEERIEQLVAQLSRHEAEHGPAATAGGSATGTSGPAASPPG